MGHFRSQPTLFDESILFLKEALNTGIANHNMPQSPPPATLRIRFPIAAAPVPVRLVAVPAPSPAFSVAAAPAPLVAPDTADVTAEPQAAERPQLLFQDIRFTNDDIF